MPLYCAYIYVHFSTAAPLCHHMINLHDVRPTALQWLSSNTGMLQVVKNWKAEEKNCKASYSYSTAGGSEKFYLEILIGITFLDEWIDACFLRPSARRCLDILQIQGIRVSLGKLCKLAMQGHYFRAIRVRRQKFILAITITLSMDELV